jgi:amidase
MISNQNMTILPLQDAMDKTQTTARDTVLFCLSRVAGTDQREGGLNSVLEINPDALFVADMLDRERERTRSRPIAGHSHHAQGHDQQRGQGAHQRGIACPRGKPGPP